MTQKSDPGVQLYDPNQSTFASPLLLNGSCDRKPFHGPVPGSPDPSQIKREPLKCNLLIGSFTPIPIFPVFP